MSLRTGVLAMVIGAGSMRARILAVVLGCAAMCAAAPLAYGSHTVFGDNFGIAPATDSNGGPVGVFGGPDAFWMGVCDTELGDTGGSGIGTPSLGLDCIDHGRGYTPVDLLDPNPVPPWENTWAPGQAPDWRLDTANQAGGHPDVSVSFWYKRYPHNVSQEFGTTAHALMPDGEPKDVIVHLPAGFLGDPNAVPRCPADAVRVTPPRCDPRTQVGVATIALPEGGSGAIRNQRVPVFNVEPRRGKLAEFVLPVNINAIDRVNIPLVARARTDGDFGVDTLAVDLPSGLPSLGQTVTLWGVPWAASHDMYRSPSQYDRFGDVNGQEGIPEGGLPDPSGNQPQSYERSWGAVRPFVVAQTECDPVPPTTGLEIGTWRHPDELKAFSHVWDEAISGCADVPFDPSLDIAPTSTVADGPSGLSTDIVVPQLPDAPFEVPDEGATAGEVSDYVADTTEFWRSGDSGAGPTSDHLSTSQLRDAVVSLPEGVSVNPAAAAGLEGCSDAQFGLVAQGPPAVFTKDDPFDGQGAECPDGSKLGKVDVYSPALPRGEGEQPGDPNLVGDVVLGSPRAQDINCPDGQRRPSCPLRVRLFLVLRSEERGLVAKVSGSNVADPVTGKLTARFEQSPRVPFETMHLELKGGQRGIVANPQRCGPTGWSSTLTPWTAAHNAGGQAVTDTGVFNPSSRCDFGFAPEVNAGVSDRTGGGSGAFSFTMSRQDGEQWLSGLTAELPHGLLASVGDVPLCTNAQAAAAACPVASRLGTVDAGSGSGDPFFLEKKGSVYLTEGYKGAPYGMAAVIPVEVAPFTGAFALETIVVRQALHVDPNTATARVVSDPFPKIHHGIPLRVRQATVVVDRPGFIRNPTDCSPKEIVSKLSSTEGANVTVRTPFQASRCGELGFKPKLALRLTGKKQTKTNGHPGVKALLTMPAGQAGIKQAVVRLPESLALDPDNARALCEFADGTKDDLENHCPKGSIVGRARVVSPLLSRPLTGNVYFVKNVRIDKKTGNEIRTLPMIMVALRGEIAINLKGESDTTRDGALVNTFTSVPDAPVSRFNLNIKGGSKGILAVTRTRRARINLCAKPKSHVAEADMDGHNGKRFDRNVRMKTPCTKKQTKNAKRAAKRAARRG